MGKYKKLLFVAALLLLVSSIYGVALAAVVLTTTRSQIRAGNRIRIPKASLLPWALESGNSSDLLISFA